MTATTSELKTSTENLHILTDLCSNVLDTTGISLYPPETGIHTAHETQVSALYDEKTQLVFHIVRDNRQGKPGVTTISWNTPEGEEPSIPNGIIKITGSALSIASDYTPKLYKPELYATIQAPTHVTKKIHRVSNDHVSSVITALQSAEPYEGQTNRDAIMLKAWTTLHDRKVPMIDKYEAAEALRQLAIMGQIEIIDLVEVFGEPLKKLMSWQSQARFYIESLPFFLGAAASMSIKESAHEHDGGHGH